MKGPAAAIQVSYQPEIVVGEDFMIFIRPRQTSISAERLGEGALSISWRLGADYLVFDQPIRTYAHEAPRGEWTAFGIPWPNVVGLLTFEIQVRLNGADAQLIGSGEVLAGTYRRMHRRDLWVYAWSPTALRAAPSVPSKPVSALAVRLEPLAVLDTGEVLNVMSVGVDTVAPPEAVHFDRFPYDFGAGRLACDIPHGPEAYSSFLLPVSSSGRGWPISATFLAISGRQASRLDLSTSAARSVADRE